MLKKIDIKVIASLAILFLLVGCGSEGAETGVVDKTPTTIHKTLLYFKEESKDKENYTSLGSLYMKKEDGAVQKIASDVIQDEFKYINDTEDVLFIDKSRTLYEYGGEESPVKIGNNVQYFDLDYVDQGKIVYTDENDSLYVYSEGSSEKISQDFREYKIVGNQVYYTDLNNKLLIFNMVSKEETRLTEKVSSFLLLNKEGDVAYVSEDGELYHLTAEKKENIKLESKYVEISSLRLIGDDLYYTQGEEYNETSLKKINLKENSRSEIIVKDIYNYEIDKNTIYYLASNGSIYSITKTDEAPKRIATDVYEFQLTKDNLIYRDEEGTIYKRKLTTGEEEEIGNDVNTFDITNNGDIVYTSDKQELFFNKMKLASDQEYYSYFFGTVAFARDEKIYIMDQSGEEKVMEDDLSDYSSVYYQNQLIYQKTLSLKDISGVWKVEYDGERTFIEITSSGEFIYLNNDYSEQLEISSSDFSTIEATMDGSYVTFEDNGSGLIMDDGYDTLQLSPSTKEDAENYMADVQLQELTGEASYTVEWYIDSLSDAIYYGDFSYISSYLDSQSVFYKTQENFIKSQYNASTYEDLIDYSILEITDSGEGIIKVITEEEFEIYDGDSYEGTMSQYRAVYTLKERSGQLYITDMKVISE